MRQKSSNLAVVVNNEFPNKENAVQVKRTEITNVLQTTLDVEELLMLFSKQIENQLQLDSFSFVNNDLAITICNGNQAKHACDYKLVIADENLGTITFSRRLRFKKQDIVQLEALLCCLVYPLRNALLYQQALLSARTDALTGVLNRTALTATLERECELARRQKSPLSMIMIDIDHFKSINDQHGHQTGDAVLKKVADCIQHVVRKSDIVFRYGGEEFVIILSNTGLSGALLLSERIRRAIELIEWDTIVTGLTTTASFGVAGLKDNVVPSKFLCQVDAAMYQAKTAGRNRVAINEFDIPAIC